MSDKLVPIIGSEKGDDSFFWKELLEDDDKDHAKEWLTDEEDEEE